MSQGDTKVRNTNVVDHVDSYDELVSRLASVIMSLENEKAKTLKLEKENSFLKNSCEKHKHLLDVLKSLHDKLKLTHEKLFMSHEELLEQHAFLIKAFTKKLKNNESSSHESSDQLQHVTNSCDIGKKHVSTSYDDLLDMP
jgi:phosphoenolpyruvate-protein kinase (PTS system EI component)